MTRSRQLTNSPTLACYVGVEVRHLQQRAVAERSERIEALLVLLPATTATGHRLGFQRVFAVKGGFSVTNAVHITAFNTISQLSVIARVVVRDVSQGKQIRFPVRGETWLARFAEARPSVHRATN